MREFLLRDFLLVLNTRNLTFLRRKSMPYNHISICIPLFAERGLVNHTIEEKHVKNLDDCELFCYLNDNCVSLNFKKDPDNNDAHIYELNNATHLRYDSD